MTKKHVDDIVHNFESIKHNFGDDIIAKCLDRYLGIENGSVNELDWVSPKKYRKFGEDYNTYDFLSINEIKECIKYTLCHIHKNKDGFTGLDKNDDSVIRRIIIGCIGEYTFKKLYDIDQKMVMISMGGDKGYDWKVFNEIENKNITVDVKTRQWFDPKNSSYGREGRSFGADLLIRKELHDQKIKNDKLPDILFGRMA